MKVSKHWIREWVSLKNGSNIIAEQITMLGFKSSNIVNKEVNGIVLSCIKKIIKYTDKYKLCIVEDGKHFWQVICSTKVMIGQKIAFAKIGTLLPKNVKILNKVFYGIESWGIFCNYSEIKLIGVKHKDIIFFPKDAPIGFDIGKLKNVIDIEGLPNRSDCLSIRGIARELCVINKLKEKQIRNTVNNNYKNTRKFLYSIKNFVPKYCPKLCSRVIEFESESEFESIDVTTSTPWWIYERLQISGIASVDLIVDIINYVMLELGQPINCYDLNNIKGTLTVRMAKKYENITLLNGKNIKLKEDTLIIADEKGPLNIAGIIGSKRTKINKNTKNILLFSAFFIPSIIVGKASYYGLYTDLAYRYERGVDSKMQNVALERITNFLIDLANTNISNIEVKSYLINKRIIKLKILNTKTFLGYHIKKNEIEDILNRLSFNIIKKNINVWSIKIPCWRFDISSQQDLIEELARIFGYNILAIINPKNNPITQIQNKIQATQDYSKSEKSITKKQIYSTLISRGYKEVITYSFISPKLHKYLQPQISTPIITNPFSKEFSVMRSSLWPGLIKALIYNFNRQQTRIALFELGLVFNGNKVRTVKQVEKLGCIFTGKRYIGGFNNSKTDFFDIKGDLELLLRLGCDFQSWKFKAAFHPALQYGQSAKILRSNKKVGWIGTLTPPISYYFGLPFEIFIFELDLASLRQGKLPKFNNVSRFPEITRDLALLIKKDFSVSKVMDQIRIKAGKYLIELILFDVYPDFFKGYNSIALRLTWQHPFRTLFDKEIDLSLHNLLFFLKSSYGIVARS